MRGVGDRRLAPDLPRVLPLAGALEARDGLEDVAVQAGQDFGRGLVVHPDKRCRAVASPGNGSVVRGSSGHQSRMVSAAHRSASAASRRGGPGSRSGTRHRGRARLPARATRSTIAAGRPLLQARDEGLEVGTRSPPATTRRRRPASLATNPSTPRCIGLAEREHPEADALHATAHRASRRSRAGARSVVAHRPGRPVTAVARASASGRAGRRGPAPG